MTHKLEANRRYFGDVVFISSDLNKLEANRRYFGDVLFICFFRSHINWKLIVAILVTYFIELASLASSWKYISRRTITLFSSNWLITKPSINKNESCSYFFALPFFVFCTGCGCYATRSREKRRLHTTCSLCMIVVHSI